MTHDSLHSVGGGSDLRLWTVNGDLIGHVHCREIICSVAFSNQPEGVSVNVIAGGLENGVVRWAETFIVTFLCLFSSRDNELFTLIVCLIMSEIFSGCGAPGI